jgi:lysyl-tRNA synthetase class II
VFRTKTNELTIWGVALEFLAKCLVPLPEKWHGLTDIEVALSPALPRPDRQSRLAQVFESRARGGGIRRSSISAGSSRSRRR